MPAFFDGDRGSADTLTELLRRRAERQPNQHAFTFLVDGETRAESLTYAALDRRARAIAVALQQQLRPGDRALLAYDSGLDFIATFFGCLYAGIVAVPVARPGRRGAQRFRAIAEASGATISLSPDERRHRARSTSTDACDALPAIDIAACDLSLATEWTPSAAARDTIAFVQFTSGSTAKPRGVVLTHGNLLHNQLVISREFGTTDASSVGGWLPLYHDMGLIGTVLHPIFMGIPCVLMAPAHFIERPIRWLHLLSRYRSTISGGPNFAFDLCIRRTSIEERATLDLSAWKVAFNGAEPVRPQTLRGFAAAFSVAGFDADACHPCYGLAEATLFVAGRAHGPAPVTARFDRASLASGRACPRDERDEHSRELIAYRPCTEAQDLRIVSPETMTLCRPGEVGEIWIAGPSIARGYWNQPDETTHTFDAHVADIDGPAFLRTGDLGFVHDGRLFIAGRSKDLIILRGRNLYPEDIERSVHATHPLLRPDAVVAFSVDVDGSEGLVVVHEVERSYRSEARHAVAYAIRRAIADQHDVQVEMVVLVTIGQIPRTTSGKLQRGACKARFLAGTLNEVARITSPPLLDAEDPLVRQDLLRLSDAERRQRVLTLMRDAVSAVLGIPASDVDFSAPPAVLGFDSLMAVDLQHRLERTLGIQMSSATLWQDASLTTLADDACKRLAPEASEGSRSEPAGQEFALSEGQRALWLMEQMAGQTSRGVLSRAMTVHGALDVPAFITALNRLVERHPALRTTIGSSRGELMQCVNEDDTADVAFIDAAGWTAQALIDRVQEEFARPMDLERGPLFRARLLRRSDHDHVLILSVHHAVADFWSLAVALNDLEECYSAARSGRLERLAPLDASYRDFVQREQVLLNGEGRETLWTYWQQRLNGAPHVLELHGDRPRPALQTFRGATCWCKIEPSVVRQLKGLAKAQGTTLFTVLLAAYQALLHRLTGQTDLLVGVPVANRREASWRGLVGYFVNLVVMRGDFTGKPTFAALLHRTQSTMAGALAHQDLPFRSLVERLRPERDLSRPPLVQYSLGVLSDHGFHRPGIAALAAGDPDTQVPLSDLSLSPFGVEPAVSEFDLNVTLAETGEMLTARFDYNSDVFDAATIRSVTTRWQALLAAIATRPTESVALLPVMTESEQRRVLALGRGDRRTIHAPPTHRIFEAQVPSATEAVVADEESDWTFEQVNGKANQLGRSLRRMGVGAETRVALCLGRSVTMLVAALGVLKAGGTYVPLDPAHPSKRLAFILDETRAPVLIVDRAAENLFPSYRGLLIRLHSSWDAMAREDPRNLTGDTHPEQAAYVLYTSGSTGLPNGVVVSHRALGNLLGSMERRPGLSRTDRLLSVTTLAFDIAALELFLPLTTGASLMIASQDTINDSSRLAALIASWNATVMQATPATWQMLIDAAWTGKRDLKALCGGEALSVGLAQGLVSRCATVWNSYGPTETTIYSTSGQVRTSEAIGLGRPIENTEIYVLDSERQMVPIGVSGEIYIGGDGLARGYLGRPDLTAERFIPDSFSGGPGRRLYRTGDRARFRADDSLEFLGRADHQIKLRGFRIDPHEIEAAARTHPLVHDVVVMAREHPRGDKALVAYVVGELASDVTLREQLAATLPSYMVPAAIVALSSLPRTPNGKVDRKALPLPPWDLVASAAQWREPADGLERTIAQIWCDVLKVDAVSAADNFFDLGGHSLLLNRVRTQLAHTLHREIPALELFRHPTIEALARYLGDSSMQAAAGHSLALPADRADGRAEGAVRLRQMRQRRKTAPSLG